MQAASTGSAPNRARAASRSPPMWSPCSPTPMSKRRTCDVGARGAGPRRAAATAAAAWPAASRRRRCRRSARAGRRATGRASRRAPTTTDVQVAVGVAHRDRRQGDAARRRQPPGADPGERRVPRHVDAARHEVLDLALVVRVQDVVEVQPARPAQPGAEPVPDRDDLGVVGDRAEHQAGSVTEPSRDVPEQRQAAQRAADEVVERVGRRRHHPRRPGVAEAAARPPTPCGTPRRRRRAARGRPRPRRPRRPRP